MCCFILGPFLQHNFQIDLCIIRVTLKKDLSSYKMLSSLQTHFLFPFLNNLVLLMCSVYHVCAFSFMNDFSPSTNRSCIHISHMFLNATQHLFSQGIILHTNHIQNSHLCIFQHVPQ